MQEVIPFQDRVCKVIIENAPIFRDTFLKYDYLLCSEAFTKKFHFITAHEGNYLHLTGVHTNYRAIDFYRKCINQSLRVTDFDFRKLGVSVSSVKGSVREKIAALPYLDGFFSKPIFAMEGFKNNQVIGTFSTSDKKITLGFMRSGYPISLLKGFKLNNNCKPVEVVLRKERGAEKFSEIIYGVDKLPEYEENICSLYEYSDDYDEFWDNPDNRLTKEELLRIIDSDL